MRKKYVQIITVFIVLFQFVFPGFVYVEARQNDTKQPEVCDGPSDMMSNYFDFQKDAIKILLGSEVNSLRFSTSFNNGLFTNQSLTLKGTSAIDFLASNVVGSMKSFVSNAITSMALLILASESTIRSNTEGLAILFKDRPIVRDYKQMLDIETTLFDVAYFRSKQVDLTQQFEGDLKDSFNSLIKKYQGVGLLEPGSEIKGSETLANIIYDLVAMNAAMKHFIIIGGDLGEEGLWDYNGCAGNLDKDRCTRGNSIFKFSEKAITQLSEDYKDVRTYGDCNSYKASFNATINKTINNNLNSVKTASKDVKDAMKRLGSTLMGSYDGKKPESRCDLSDYEMAQLKAYWGGDWTCSESFINVDASSALLKTKDYFNQKKAQAKQSEKTESVLKKADKPESKEAIMGNVTDMLKSNATTEERTQLWYRIYGNNTNYNSDFSFDLDSDFTENFQSAMDQYAQALENGVATNQSSDLFPRGKGILDQMTTVIKNTDDLEKHLQHIEDKQCTG